MKPFRKIEIRNIKDDKCYSKWSYKVEDVNNWGIAQVVLAGLEDTPQEAFSKALKGYNTIKRTPQY